MTAQQVLDDFVNNGKTDADAQSGEAYRWWALDWKDKVPPPPPVVKMNSLAKLSEYIASVYAG